MIRSAICSAITCWWRWRSGCAAASETAMSARVSAATNSPCCWPAPPIQFRLRSGSLPHLRSPFQLGGHDVFISVSIGIASGREEAETLLRNADVAMYHAKRAGADRYARFEPQMHAARLSRLGLDTELRGAVERAEFELHYQPIVRAGLGQDRRVRGTAALAPSEPRSGRRRPSSSRSPRKPA